MTTVLLIRHAHTDVIGRVLAGRQKGVVLSQHGERQARQLAAGMQVFSVTRIFTSPLERARQTADILRQQQTIPLEVAEELNEFDFGRWSGRTFTDLQPDAYWSVFNTLRSTTRAPDGESMLEVQARVTQFIELIAERYADETVALVSHGDVIRAAVCFYLGVPLDMFLRVTIDPASVSILSFARGTRRVVAMNAGPVAPSTGA